MKKILSLLIASVMIITMTITAIPASAADYAGNVTFSLTNAAGGQNDEITVDLYIDENPGLAAFWLLLYYESDTFILRDVKYTSEIREYGTFESTNNNLSVDQLIGPVSVPTVEAMKNFNIDTEDKNYKVIYFDSKSLEEDVDYTGKVATFTFQIMGIAEDGEHTIGIMPADKNLFNIALQDLSATWINSTVAVGSDKVPEETQKPLTPKDTADPSERNDDTSRQGSDNTPVTVEIETQIETFTGDDGVVYVINNDGETEVYVEQDTPEVTRDAETVEDVKVADDGNTKSTVNLFGKRVPILYIAIAILIILVAVAAVLFVIFSKTKKSNKEK